MTSNPTSEGLVDQIRRQMRAGQRSVPMTDLKSCPFCGGTNIELHDNGIGDSYAICYSNDPSEVACGARTDDANCETDEGAISRWNKRASPPGGEWQGIETASQSQPKSTLHGAHTTSQPSVQGEDQ